MRVHVLACRVLTRELSHLAATSGNIIDITWLPQGLHDTPSLLRDTLQQALDRVYAEVANGTLKHRPDAIALGYGLCSNGVVGLKNGDLPLVIPRCDDCIALFLGSQRRYLSLFEQNTGTFWLNGGWIETCYSTTEERHAHERALRDRYAEDYGEENADFLIEQEYAWKKHYTTCAFIRSPVRDDPAHLGIARDMAAENGWTTKAYDGDMSFLEKLVSGPWDEEAFLVCPPGGIVEAAYDGQKIVAGKENKEEAR